MAGIFLYILMKKSVFKTIAHSIAVVVVAMLWLVAPLEVALWGTFAIMCLLFAVPVQMVGTAAMSLLLMVALSQLNETWALYSERLAVYVFYLLCIMVGLQLRSLWQHQELEPVLPPGTLFIPKRIIRGEPFRYHIPVVRVPNHSHTKAPTMAPAGRMDIVKRV